MGSIFKKYWIVGGSFWNKWFGKSKTNSSSLFDLETIIHRANRYEEIHMGLLVGSIIGGILAEICDRNSQNKSKKLLISSIILNGYVVLMQEYNKLLSSQKIEQLQLTNVEPTQDTPKNEYIQHDKFIQKDKYPEGIAIRKQWNNTYCWHITTYGSCGCGLDIGHQYINLESAETALFGFDKYIDKFRDVNIVDRSVNNSQLYAKADYIGRIKEYLSETDYTDFKSTLNW